MTQVHDPETWIAIGTHEGVAANVRRLDGLGHVEFELKCELPPFPRLINPSAGATNAVSLSGGWDGPRRQSCQIDQELIALVPAARLRSPSARLFDVDWDAI